MTMHALDQLRAGNTADGIRKIESLCFASANMVYGDPVYRDDNISLLYASDLIQYRSKYRNNPGQWTPAETNLESLLAHWK